MRSRRWAKVFAFWILRKRRCEPPSRVRLPSRRYTRVPSRMTTPCEPTGSFSVANAERRQIRTSRRLGDGNTTKNQTLEALNLRGAVKRSGETGNIETPDPALLGSAGSEPSPHNPRKQRKNPAAAGSGERFRGGKWRTGRDSNPRDGLPPTHFPGARLRPLGHLSEAVFMRKRMWDARAILKVS